MTEYRPMTLADLAGFLIREPNDEVRWKLVWEFFEEYRGSHQTGSHHWWRTSRR